jgi:hypothetical protein
MTTGTAESAVADLVAGLDELTPCSSVFRATGEAVWRVDQRGRIRAAACTAHVMRWVQEVTRKIGMLGFVKCRDCDGIFTTVEQSAQSGRFECGGNRITAPNV